MLLIITAAFLLNYGFLIFYYFYYWLHAKEFTLRNNPAVFTSVVVPARNEEENIGHLLKALEEQTYPKEFFEVIIVDDYSTDKTQAAVQLFLNERIHLIQPNADSNQSSKKKALEAGIQKAKGELIVITDADCLPKYQWLQGMAS